MQPVIEIEKIYEDANYNSESEDSFEIYSYLNPENVKSVFSRLLAHSATSQWILTNQDVPCVRIFTEETLTIPIGLNIKAPVGYSLVLEPSNELVMDKGIDVLFSQVFFQDDQSFVLIRNNSETTKYIYHDEFLAKVRLTKNIDFDVNLTVRKGEEVDG